MKIRRLLTLPIAVLLLCGGLAFAQTSIINPRALEFDHPAVDVANTTTYRIGIIPTGGTAIETDVPRSTAIQTGGPDHYRLDIATLVNNLPTSGTLLYTATIEAIGAAGSSGRSAPTPVPFTRQVPPGKVANLVVR